MNVRMLGQGRGRRGQRSSGKFRENIVEREFYEEVVLIVITAIFSLFVGAFLGEPLKRWWGNWLDKRKKIKDMLRPRFKFNVIQLQDPESPAFNFSRRITEQYDRQNLFSFEIQESLRDPTPAEIADLKRTVSKRDFVEKVGRFLAHARNESWSGLSDNPPTKRFKGSRDLVITNLPLPGNFYAWNSKDRTLLVISTAPSQSVLPQGGKLTVEDFVVRITQRMAIFAVTPRLDPSRDHVSKSLGCLFDFTLHVSRVVDILETCIICRDCREFIAQDRGIEFALQVREWVEDKPLRS